MLSRCFAIAVALTMAIPATAANFLFTIAGKADGTTDKFFGSTLLSSTSFAGKSLVATFSLDTTGPSALTEVISGSTAKIEGEPASIADFFYQLTLDGVIVDQSIGTVNFAVVKTNGAASDSLSLTGFQNFSGGGRSGGGRYEFSLTAPNSLFSQTSLFENFAFTSTSVTRTAFTARFGEDRPAVDFGRDVTDTRLSAVGPMTVTMITSSPAAVPEAATWALMVAGFGLAGIKLRRRSAADLQATRANTARNASGDA